MRFKEVVDFGDDFFMALHRAKLIPLNSSVSLIFCLLSTIFGEFPYLRDKLCNKHITYTQAGVSSPLNSFVGKESSALRINFSSKKSRPACSCKTLAVMAKKHRHGERIK